MLSREILSSFLIGIREPPKEIQQSILWTYVEGNKECDDISFNPLNNYDSTKRPEATLKRSYMRVRQLDTAIILLAQTSHFCQSRTQAYLTATVKKLDANINRKIDTSDLLRFVVVSLFSVTLLAKSTW